MPGKQMAIDADLNAGMIDDTEAKRRRKEIADEADFYGAMDGASKFVKGDAIAAIVIVLIGGVALATLPVAQYPEIAPPTINVRLRLKPSRPLARWNSARSEPLRSTGTTVSTTGVGAGDRAGEVREVEVRRVVPGMVFFGFRSGNRH